MLSVGSLLATFHQYPDTLELNMQGVRAVERLALDRAALEMLVSESSTEVAQVRQTLGL